MKNITAENPTSSIIQPLFPNGNWFHAKDSQFFLSKLAFPVLQTPPASDWSNDEF